MNKTAKQFIALFLTVVVLGVLAWRLWPDGGRARRQQRNTDLVRAVVRNNLADATGLLDEGAGPNTQMPSFSTSQKAEWYLFEVSHRMKPPTWRQMDDLNPHFSVLQIAAMHGSADMVSELLSKGAASGYRDKAGHTALGEVEGARPALVLYRWNGRNYPRVIALLRAAEARKKTPTPSPSPQGQRI